jgi:hypothetical protein
MRTRRGAGRLRGNLVGMDYRWFAIAAKGALLPISCDQESYDANLVALPVERTEEFLGLLGQK